MKHLGKTLGLSTVVGLKTPILMGLSGAELRGLAVPLGLGKHWAWDLWWRFHTSNK